MKMMVGYCSAEGKPSCYSYDEGCDEANSVCIGKAYNLLACGAVIISIAPFLYGIYVGCLWTRIVSEQAETRPRPTLPEYGRYTPTATLPQTEYERIQQLRSQDASRQTRDSSLGQTGYERIQQLRYQDSSRQTRDSSRARVHPQITPSSVQSDERGQIHHLYRPDIQVPVENNQIGRASCRERV